jgi:hypothetical protein
MGGSVGAGGSVAGGSVGASVIGGSVGAGVAGAQAETTSTSTVITAKSRFRDFFIFLLLLKYWIRERFPIKTDNTAY